MQRREIGDLQNEGQEGEKVNEEGAVLDVKDCNLAPVHHQQLIVQIAPCDEAGVEVEQNVPQDDGRCNSKYPRRLPSLLRALYNK